MSIVKAKTLLGLILIVISVFSLVLWEVKGRDLLLTDTVLVINQDIEKGIILTADVFSELSLPNGAIIIDALLPHELEHAVGKISNAPLYKGSQISKRQLSSKEKSESSNHSYFVLPNEWIYMCSSSVRAGDKIDIVSKSGDIEFGNYKLAFVKDSEGKEIISGRVDAGTLFNSDINSSGNSSPINHVEIVCDFSQYMNIKSFAENESTASLIFIKRGESNG